MVPSTTPPDEPSRPPDDATLPADPADDTVDLERTRPSQPGAPAGAEPPLPERLGNYRILSLLGHGGMGVVYEAEQENPRRRVALKVIRGGAFHDEVQRRLFEREAQSLGRLKHPGIAAIHEAGQTEDGQPYFAMELVRGKTLDEATAKPEGETLTRQDVERRLRLLRRACEAVNYAHQRGVIHRDLKPANILVADDLERDGLPEVKVLDFGVAKIADPGAQDSLTHAGTLRGTIAYMSPEQLSGDPDAIDARSDVYSLGVVLYTLLCGALPFDLGSSIATAIRELTQSEPRPIRRAWQGKFSLDADLETIVKTAMARDIERRYATAAALADDIGRYLARQPIQARPASTAYQLRKLVERNKLATGAAVAFVLMLVGFGAWMTVLYQRALAAEAASTREARTANEVSDFLVELFAGVDPRKARGDDVTARELLDLGAERVSKELAEQPEIAARMMSTIGWSYHNLGLYDDAMKIREEALRIAEARLGSGATKLAQYLHDMSCALEQKSRFEEARSYSERAVAAFTADLGPAGESTLSARSQLASMLQELGDYDAAREEFEAILEVWGDREPTETIGNAHNNLGALYQDLQDLDAATTHFESAIAIYQEVLQPGDPRIADPILNLSMIRSNAGELDEAMELMDRGLSIQRHALGVDHPSVIAQSMNLAILRDMSGNADEAERLFLGAAQALEDARGPEHQDLAQVLGNLGFFYQSHGRPQEAIPVLERSLAIREKIFGADHLSVSLSAYHLANALRDTGRYREAKPLYLRVLAIDEAALGHDHPDLADDLEEYAKLLRAMGDDGEAERAEARIKTILEKASAGSE